MKSNEKLEMKFHLKAKYHIHSNLYVVKWSDNDGPPYTCQNKVSADRYHVTISRAQVYSSSMSRGFILKLTADQVLVFYWIAGSG